MKIIGPLHRNTEMPPASSSIRLSQRVTLPLHPDQSVSHAAKNIAHARQHSFPEIIKLVTLFVSVIGGLSILAARASAEQDPDEDDAGDDTPDIDDATELPPALLSVTFQTGTQIPAADASQPAVRMTGLMAPSRPVFIAHVPEEMRGTPDPQSDDSPTPYRTHFDKPFPDARHTPSVHLAENNSATNVCHSVFRFSHGIPLGRQVEICPSAGKNTGSRGALRHTESTQSMKDVQYTAIRRDALTAESIKRAPQRAMATHTDKKSPRNVTAPQQAAVQATSQGAQGTVLDTMTRRSPNTASEPGKIPDHRMLAAPGAAHSVEPKFRRTAPAAIGVPDTSAQETAVYPLIRQKRQNQKKAEALTDRFVAAPDATALPLTGLVRNTPPVLTPLTVLQGATPALNDLETRLAAQRKMLVPGQLPPGASPPSDRGRHPRHKYIKLCVIIIIVMVLFYHCSVVLF